MTAMPPPPPNPPKGLSEEQAQLLANAVMLNQQASPLPNVGHAIADKATGVCMPAIIGYSFGVLIAVFGAGGTLFGDLPGELKRTMFGTQAAIAVGFVLASSVVDSANRYSTR